MTGRATLRIGLALILVGAAFDSPSLYVPGAALMILSFGLRAWVAIAARGVRVERLAGPWNVVEGEPYPFELEIARGRIPPPGAALLDPLLERPITLPVRLPGRVAAEGSFSRRGRHLLEPATLRIGDPLGMRSADVKGRTEVEVLVLPRVEALQTAGGEGGAAEEELGEGWALGVGDTGPDTGAIEFEIDGLRPYRDGTPASRIHWPSVARTGELLEYKMITGGQASPLFVLDAADPVDEEHLDKAVRAAASLCVHLAGHSGCAILIPGETRPLEVDVGLRSWPQVHGRLALVQPHATLPRLRRGMHVNALFWVSAAASPPPLGRTAPGFARSVFVSPLPPGGARPLFSVAGCQAVRFDAALAVESPAAA